jgi:acetyltransferase-like isoleucine patch superfamily enzyme
VNKYLRALIVYPTGAVKTGLLKLLHGADFSAPALSQISPRTEITVDRGAKLSIGQGFKMRPGAVLRVRRGAVCRIGKNVSMNLNNMLACQQSVTIGDDVLLSPNVQIYDHDHDYRAAGGAAAMQYVCSPVVIGSNVWIGANTVILRGTVIGDNCVVGAGCVLRGEIPAGSVVTQGRQTELHIREAKP